MSSYVDRYKVASTSQSFLGVLPEEFCKRYPSLSQVLCGVKSENSSAAVVAKATIMIFEDAGQLKFSIHPKTGAKVGFGCFTCPIDGFPGLEQEIEAGRFEWKETSGRKARLAASA